MMILTILRSSTTFDEWGNPVETTTEESYEIDEIDFQVYDRGDILKINNDGTFKHSYRILFLKDELKDIALDVGEIVQIDGREYKVVQIQQYQRHKEVILVGLE